MRQQRMTEGDPARTCDVAWAPSTVLRKVPLPVPGRIECKQFSYTAAVWQSACPTPHEAAHMRFSSIPAEVSPCGIASFCIATNRLFPDPQGDRV